MKPFARFTDYGTRVEMYLSASAENITKTMRWVKVEPRSKYIVITPCAANEIGALSMRQKSKKSVNSRTICVTDLFKSGVVSKRWLDKRLPLKKMTKDGVISLVVCLEESGVV